MNYGPIERPAPSKNKIKTSDDWELCYLRHQYVRRAKYNPTEEEMQPYAFIIENFARKNFFTYFDLFRTVGMYHEDISSIGKVHLVSFLGLYHLDRMPDKKKEFVNSFAWKNYRDPNEKELLDKNKANFTLFLKQRMEDLIRVCHQKSRNIRGQSSEEYLVFCGPNRPPKFHRRILREHEQLGYKKVDFAVFKSIRRKANVNFDATIFEFSGTWYVAIPLLQKPVTIEDITNAGFDPYKNNHNMQPADILEEKQFEQFSTDFESKPKEKRIKIIRKFISKNRKNNRYKTEIGIARKMLRTLGG